MKLAEWWSEAQATRDRRLGERAHTSQNAERVAITARCAGCQHRAEDRQSLEQRVAGLITLSSGFGASVASSRLCVVHDQFVSPGDRCSSFSPRV